jgi:PAS domain S-box-containing protein
MESQVPDEVAPQKEKIPVRIRLDRFFALAPLKICLIYFVFGILWIIFSDQLFLSFAMPQEDLILISSIKGILFIVVTTVLLFLLIRHFTHRLQEKNEELWAAYEQLAARKEELRAQYEALALSHAEWEATYNAIPDWISLISPDGRILRTNGAVESMFGISPDQVIGRNCFDIVHGTACPIEGCPRMRMHASRKRESVEVPLRNKKGWLLITVDPVVDGAGKIVSAVHIVRDISERTQEQKALEQAKKKLNLLNYVTFNDIQNLVFSLWGYQQLAKGKTTEISVISVIKKEEEILQKISNSLKFAQAYQDLGLKPPAWQDLRQIFLLAISHLDTRKIKHSIELDDLTIFADPLLEQVLQILADNTLTHGETTTQITLRYLEGQESITVFFEDDGVGISQDLKARIFSPDFQKTKSVGLFLAREILEITGISIQETGTTGKGARFEIIVPKEAYRFSGREKEPTP